MQKNVASQKAVFYAFDSTTNLPKTGDAANITPYESLDWGAVTAITDTSMTEMDSTNAKGYYVCDLTQGETNANFILFSAKSSTANIVVIGAPAAVQTVPASFVVAPGSAGAIAIGGSNAATTFAGLTTGALSCTTITASGAVAFQSTFAVTTSTALAALSCTTLTASGAVALQSTLTITGATVLTGNVSMAAGLTITQSVANTAALVVTGNGTGNGATITSGSGATGTGLAIAAASTNGSAVITTATGTGSALKLVAISGDALLATVSTSGHGASFTSGGGGKNAIHLVGNNAGLNATGGNYGIVGQGASGGGYLEGTVTPTALEMIGALTVGAITTSGTVTLTALTVTGTTTLAAVTTSGTVTMNALTVSNATTLTGAVSATNAGNDFRGVRLSATGSAALPEQTGDPGATPTLGGAISLIYMALRNKRDTTATADIICNSAGATILTAVLSDDTVTFEKGKYA